MLLATLKRLYAPLRPKGLCPFGNPKLTAVRLGMGVIRPLTRPPSPHPELKVWVIPQMSRDFRGISSVASLTSVFHDPLTSVPFQKKTFCKRKIFLLGENFKWNQSQGCVAPSETRLDLDSDVTINTRVKGAAKSRSGDLHPCHVANVGGCKGAKRPLSLAERRPFLTSRSERHFSSCHRQSHSLAKPTYKCAFLDF